MHSIRFVFSRGGGGALRPGAGGESWRSVWPPDAVDRRLRSPSACGSRFRAAREANSRLTSRIQETLAGIRVIKAYGAEERRAGALRDGAASTAFREAFHARNLFAGLPGADLLGAGQRGARRDRASPRSRRATLAPVFTDRGRLHAWNLGLYNFFKLRVGDGDRIRARDLYRTWGRVQDIAIGLGPGVRGPRPRARGAGRARRRRARAASRRGRHLRDVQLRLSARIGRCCAASTWRRRIGTITAIVGPTGSGKSTLMALLLRLFDPERGQRRDRRRRPAEASSSRSLREPSRSRCRRTCSSATPSARTSATRSRGQR